jgi:hypothetical protein
MEIYEGWKQGFGCGILFGLSIGMVIFSIPPWIHSRRIFRAIWVGVALGSPLLWASSSQAQIIREDPDYGEHEIPPNNTATAAEIGQAVAGALFGYGGGGEIPVRDKKTRTETAITAAKVTLQLVDMLKQAILFRLPEGGATGVYLEEQAAARYGEALTYGSGASEIWPETFTYSEPYPHGDYLEADLEQRRRVLDTQRTMQLLIENRQHEFANEEHRINEAKALVNGAEGRNGVMVGHAQIAVETLESGRMEQQLLMTLVNQNAAEYSDRVNQEVKRESMERYFVDNGGKSVEFPEFVDRGL